MAGVAAREHAQEGGWIAGWEWPRLEDAGVEWQQQQLQQAASSATLSPAISLRHATDLRPNVHQRALERRRQLTRDGFASALSGVKRRKPAQHHARAQQRLERSGHNEAHATHDAVGSATLTTSGAAQRKQLWWSRCRCELACSKTPPHEHLSRQWRRRQKQHHQRLARCCNGEANSCERRRSTLEARLRRDRDVRQRPRQDV